MNKQQQIEWITAFIALWDATAPHSDNNFADTGNLLDELTNVFTLFCDKYKLPQMSADELLAEMTKDEEVPSSKMFLWKDKTGRGMSNSCSLVMLINTSNEDEENYDGTSLHEWAKEAEQGDEWENSTDKYICTNS